MMKDEIDNSTFKPCKEAQNVLLNFWILKFQNIYIGIRENMEKVFNESHI